MTSRGINPAALVVVVTLGLIAVGFGLVTCLLYLRGETASAKDAGLVLLTLTGTLTGILAKTGSAVEAQPVTVENTAADPVKTVEASTTVPPVSEFTN